MISPEITNKPPKPAFYCVKIEEGKVAIFKMTPFFVHNLQSNKLWAMEKSRFKGHRNGLQITVNLIALGGVHCEGGLWATLCCKRL